MRHTRRFITTAVLVALAFARSVSAQTSSEIWRSFAQRVDVGTELNVRLHDGHRLRATLVGVRDDVVLLQPKTRISVPVQAVPYESIAGMERRQNGQSTAKAVAIGVASGVGAFFGILAIIFAGIDD